MPPERTAPSSEAAAGTPHYGPARTTRTTVATAALVLLAALALAFAGWLQRGTAPAPSIAFTTLDHGPIALESLRGRPVLVTFWATTCPACIREMPQLFSLYREFHYQGLEIIAVAMPYDPPNLVLRMTREREIPYLVAIDVMAKAAQAFGNVAVTPSSFLIDGDGRITQHWIGEMNVDQTRREIVAQLKP